MEERLKDKVDVMDLTTKIDNLYRIIGELYVENLRLKSINSLFMNSEKEKVAKIIKKQFEDNHITEDQLNEALNNPGGKE